MVVVSLSASAEATGLYLNLTSYFSPVDTARANLLFSCSELERSEGNASFLYGETRFGLGGRVQVRMGLSYPLFERDSYFVDGVGDGFVYSTFRVHGDSLADSGIFMRGDLRVPIGSKNMFPFSYSSLDGGAGIEWRFEGPLFNLRAASTFVLVGERANESDIRTNNYLLTAASLESSFLGPSSFIFSVYSVRFRGGDSREIYSVAVNTALSGSFSIACTGMLDSGNERERVFDSLLSVSILYRFPSVAKNKKSISPDLPSKTGTPVR